MSGASVQIDQLIVVVGVGLVELAGDRDGVELRTVGEPLADRRGAAGGWSVSLRLTGVKSPVRPGETPTMASVSADGRRTSSRWCRRAAASPAVVTVRVESKPRTPHQVTVYWSAAALTKTRPPVLGSRSARNGATRGGPVSSRATLRSVLARSSSSNVMLPSELTNAVVCAPAVQREAERHVHLPAVVVGQREPRPSAVRNVPSIRVTL